MNELPPEAASLLDAERRAQRAPEPDLDRTLSRLHASLVFADVAGVGVQSAQSAQAGQAAQAASTPSAAPALSAGKGALFAGKSLKVLLAGVTLGGAIGGTVLGVRMQQAEHAQPRSQSVVSAAPVPSEQDAEHEPAPPAETARATVQGDVSSARPPEAAQQEPHAEREGLAARASAPLAVRRRSAARALASSPSEQARRTGEASEAHSAAARPEAAEPAPEPVPPEAESEAASSATPAAEKARQPALPSELDLIDGAFAQLRAHQGESALELLERHEALYPRGKFATEAAGLRVLALCDAGRVREAREARRAFLAGASDSPIAARVRAACAPERP